MALYIVSSFLLRCLALCPLQLRYFSEILLYFLDISLIYCQPSGDFVQEYSVYHVILLFVFLCFLYGFLNWKFYLARIKKNVLYGASYTLGSSAHISWRLVKAFLTSFFFSSFPRNLSRNPVVKTCWIGRNFYMQKRVFCFYHTAHEGSWITDAKLNLLEQAIPIIKDRCANTKFYIETFEKVLWKKR